MRGLATLREIRRIFLESCDDETEAKRLRDHYAATLVNTGYAGRFVVDVTPAKRRVGRVHSIRRRFWLIELIEYAEDDE